MDMDFQGLASQCAANVAPQTMAAVVSVESAHNPYAIGVVGGALKRQPRTLLEALATVRELLDKGRNFSLGLAQVNRYNLPRYKVSYEQIFDPCTNLRVGGQILEECYLRALPVFGDEQKALQASFSCYYSGNFKRGFRPDKAGEPSYVQKVVQASGRSAPHVIVVPAIAGAAYAGPARPTSKATAPAWNDPVLLVGEHAAPMSPPESSESSPEIPAQTSPLDAGALTAIEHVTAAQATLGKADPSVQAGMPARPGRQPEAAPSALVF